MKRVRAACLLFAGLAVGLLWMAAAHSLPLCGDTLNTTANNRGAFDDCIGATGDNNVTGTGAPWLNTLNTHDGGAGLGGYTNWVFDRKFDGAFEGPNTLGFSLGAGSIDATSGTWHLATPTTRPLVLVLWAGGQSSAYFWDAGALTNGGTWDTWGVAVNPPGTAAQGLSGAALFLADGNGVVVPEPGTVGLVAAALLGVGLMRRRRGASAP
jgi:hypothetical protein